MTLQQQEMAQNMAKTPATYAKQVIAQEIEGLHALNSIFDASFDALVAQIIALRGRVIISGMGKSGHIAKKISATLASTGTPAYFVHPSEASHGDLGMITADDLVMCLSNSGETAELHDIIAYSRRFSIPLVALVRRKESVLTDAANIAFVLPEVPEASPTGAPTTSSTMMLAFGDALAIALAECRGFTKEDFGMYHPGGKLGKAFIKIADLMHVGDGLPLIAQDANMADALLVMTQKHFGCVGVVDAQGVLLGVITDGDLRRHMGSNLLGKTAQKVMSENPVSLRPEQLAAQALGLMNDKSITCVFIVENQKPVGIIHIHDCLRAGIM
jgi:arabinose-5-phosphate isomerase